MSDFAIDDPMLTVDEMEDVLLVALETRSRTNKRAEPKSVQELKVCYLNFCQKRDLDASTPPHEQIVASDKDQQWLDAHIQAVNLAKREKRLLARGKTLSLRETLAKLQERDLSELRDEYMQFCRQQQLPLTRQPQEQKPTTRYQARRLHIYILQLGLHGQCFELPCASDKIVCAHKWQAEQLSLL